MFFLSHLATRKSRSFPPTCSSAPRAARPSSRLSHTLATELAAGGITVNTITQGLSNVRARSLSPVPSMHTNHHSNADHGMRESYSAHKISFLAGIHPGRCIGQPKDIAGLCRWLCGSGGSFVSGPCVGVYGVSSVRRKRLFLLIGLVLVWAGVARLDAQGRLTTGCSNSSSLTGY